MYIHDNNVHIIGWYPYCRWCLSLWPRQVLVLICSRGNTWRCGIHNKKMWVKNGLKSHLKLSRAWDCLTFFRIIFSWFFWTISNAMQSWIVQSGVDQKWMLNPLLADSKSLFNTADTNSKALAAFQSRFFFARANYKIRKIITI